MKPSTSNAIKVGISVLIGSAFLALALRSVDLSEVGSLWGQIRLGWLFYFVPAVFLSFWLRMERWKLLTEHDQIRSSRKVLFAGVMNGYAVNYAVPRLGEITRCYYVARKEDKPVAAVIGTVVLERIIDLVVLLLLMAGVFFFVVTDREVVANLLGFHSTASTTEMYLNLGMLALAAAGGLAVTWLTVRAVARRVDRVGKWWQNGAVAFSHFKDGLLSVRTIAHPVRFILLTVALWACYVAMAGVPFAMLPGSGMGQLGVVEALVITVISAIGVTIPSPGGIGTYHLLVQKALHVLYGVPEPAGFTYALVSHALVLVIVLVLTPLALWVAQRRKSTPGKSDAGFVS